MSLLGRRVFVVAEAGVSNYGDVELARRQVDAAATAGADAVKFQVWHTPELVSRAAAAQHANRLGHDWYQRLVERELSREDLRELQRHARDRGLVFFATPHDLSSLAFLVEDLDVPALKVGSGEASNWDFLHAVGAAERPVFVAFGLQSDDEAHRAVEVLLSAGAPEVVAFHSVTAYPTPAALADLSRLARLRERLGVAVGLSDHTVGSHVALAAVALGARAIEKHLAFDKRDPRSLDNAGALEPDEWAAFVGQVREVEAALAAPDEAELAATHERGRAWALQAVVAARDLEAGTELSRLDLAAKRPLADGIPAGLLDSLVGRRLLRRLSEDEQLRPGDVG